MVDFNFISESEVIAKQNWPFALVLIVLGLAALIYGLNKDKQFVFILAALMLCGNGAWLGYQNWNLNSQPGKWQIQITSTHIHWLSPNEKIDRGFEIPLSEIDHILVKEYENKPENPKEYLLISDNNEIRLNPISGINLAEFTNNLESKGTKIVLKTVETAKK